MAALSGCDGGTMTGADGGPRPVADGGPLPVVDAGVDGGPTLPPDAGQGSTTLPPGAAERLVGTWAMRSSFATLQMLPFLGEQRSVTTSYGIVRIEAAGDGLQITDHGCHVETGGGGGASSEIPDAVPRSVPPQTSMLEFLESGGAWRVRRPVQPVPVGFRAAHDMDALPTMASDPRVWDQDEDGQPGVTVRVSGLASGDVYVVQWTRGFWEAPLSGSGELRGESFDAGSAQRTIGASNPILNMTIDSRPDTRTSDNVVRLIPLTGTYDCDRLMSERRSLFGE
jgi:hypothetical protein